MHKNTFLIVFFAFTSFVDTLFKMKSGTSMVYRALGLTTVFIQMKKKL